MVPGEAVKNLVHRVVREHDQAAAAIETLGIAICDAMLRTYGSIGLARVELVEQPWARLDAGGKAQGQAFSAVGVGAADRGRHRQRHAHLRAGRHRETALLRTGGFAPIARGEPSGDAAADGLQRVFLATLGARWAYTAATSRSRPTAIGVRQAIVETFAWHKGPGGARHAARDGRRRSLASYQEIAQVSLTLHERPVPSRRSAGAGASTATRCSWRTTSRSASLEISVERGAL